MRGDTRTAEVRALLDAVAARMRDRRVDPISVRRATRRIRSLARA